MHEVTGTRVCGVRNGQDLPVYTCELRQFNMSRLRLGERGKLV